MRKPILPFLFLLACNAPVPPEPQQPAVTVSSSSSDDAGSTSAIQPLRDLGQRPDIATAPDLVTAPDLARCGSNAEACCVTTAGGLYCTDPNLRCQTPLAPCAPGVPCCLP